MTSCVVCLSPMVGTIRATCAAGRVEDPEATMWALRSRGMHLEEDITAHVTTVGDVATTTDGTRQAWFTDGEGSILAPIELSTAVRIG